MLSPITSIFFGVTADNLAVNRMATSIYAILEALLFIASLLTLGMILMTYAVMLIFITIFNFIEKRATLPDIQHKWPMITNIYIVICCILKDEIGF